MSAPILRLLKDANATALAFRIIDDVPYKVQVLLSADKPSIESLIAIAAIEDSCCPDFANVGNYLVIAEPAERCLGDAIDTDDDDVVVEPMERCLGDAIAAQPAKRLCALHVGMSCALGGMKSRSAISRRHTEQIMQTSFFIGIWTVIYQASVKAPSLHC